MAQVHRMVQVRPRPLALLAVLVMIFLPVGSAAADPLPDPPTELVMTGTSEGQAVTGYIAPFGDTAFNPLNGYPSGKPAGFNNLNLGFAGIITASPPGSTTTIKTYCIDLRTPVLPGYGYVIGEWSEAQVPLVDYVARILDVYYPNSNLPAGAANANQRAAAVQAAIWFFTDKYVLAPTDPLYSLTKGIVDEVLALGPVVTPDPPSLQILAPTDPSGVVGSLVGPFTVQTDSPATVTANGAQLFADAAGTVPLVNPVGDGTQVWVRSTAAGPVNVVATAQATVPSGNVYLYDGRTQGVTSAQKLILAQTAVLQTAASATAVFFDTATLAVRKAVDGDGASLQSDIVLGVTCGGIALPDVTIPAGFGPGTSETLIGPVKTPTSCTVTEKVNGSNAAVAVSTTGSVTVDLPLNTTPGDTVPALITDTYTRNPGSLVVTKTITGTGNDLRDPIVIDVSCSNGTTASFTVPPSELPPAAGYTVSDLPAGTTCTVTETQSGGNAKVAVEVSPAAPTTVVIPAGAAADAALTNTLSTRPGQLLVTKTITGVGADARGPIELTVTCDNGSAATFAIPAGEAPENPYRVDGLPAGTTCTVTETASGGTNEVSSTVVIDPTGPVTIPPGGAAPVAVTNTFAENPGALRINKTINGPASALKQRGPITLQVVCGDLTQTFTIPPGQDPPADGFLIEGLPAGSSCDVTEAADGANNLVRNDVPSFQSSVVIPRGGTATVPVVNNFNLQPASLTVVKTITGESAGRGPIELQVTCSDGSSLSIAIPADLTPDTKGYTLGNIAGDATCSVTETQTGANGQVSVTTSGLVTDLAMTPGTASRVDVTNAFRPNPGLLTVSKTFSGAGQSVRGDVTITVNCPTGPVPIQDTWTIPAGTQPPARSYQVPAGASCTVTETGDGSNGQTSVRTSYTVNGQSSTGPVTTTMPAGGLVEVGIRNEYVLRPGTLTVTKTIDGGGAGQQGQIVIGVACASPQDSTLIPREVSGQLVIPAGTTDPQPLVMQGIPAGLVCTVAETADGATATVSVTTVAPGPVTIAAGADAAAAVRNTYSEVPVVVPVAAPAAPAARAAVTPQTGAGDAARNVWIGLWSLAMGAVLVLAARRRMK